MHIFLTRRPFETLIAAVLSDQPGVAGRAGAIFSHAPGYFERHLAGESARSLVDIRTARRALQAGFAAVLLFQPVV